MPPASHSVCADPARCCRWVGPAYASHLLPSARRSRINPARNSQLYVKALEAMDGNLAEPGKRIGF